MWKVLFVVASSSRTFCRASGLRASSWISFTWVCGTAPTAPALQDDC